MVRTALIQRTVLGNMDCRWDWAGIWCDGLDSLGRTAIPTVMLQKTVMGNVDGHCHCFV